MTARRLTLNTAGIKSPLDIAEPAAERGPREPAAGQPGAASPSGAPPRAPHNARAGKPSAPHRRAHGDSDRVSFYGGGRPLQTAIALEAAHHAQLEQLARASRLSLNAIAVAALHDGLPASSVDARSSIVEERIARAGRGERRVEYNLRIPAELRARVDELTRDSRERLPRAARADLVNAALRRSLPRDAQAATVLVAAFARNLELAHAL
jgi:hypothetical protein